MQRNGKRRVRPTESDLNTASPDTTPKNVFNKYVLAYVIGENPTCRFLDKTEWSKIYDFIDFVTYMKTDAYNSLNGINFDNDRAMQVFNFWKNRNFQKQETILMWLAKATIVMQVLSQFVTRKTVMTLIDDYELHFLKRRKIWDNLLDYDIQAERRDLLALLKNFYEDIRKIGQTTIPNPTLVQPRQSQSIAFDNTFNTAPRPSGFSAPAPGTNPVYDSNPATTASSGKLDQLHW